MFSVSFQLYFRKNHTVMFNKFKMNIKTLIESDNTLIEPNAMAISKDI